MYEYSNYNIKISEFFKNITKKLIVNHVNTVSDG
jgi:hypothetical protein